MRGARDRARRARAPAARRACRARARLVDVAAHAAAPSVRDHEHARSRQVASARRQEATSPSIVGSLVERHDDRLVVGETRVAVDADFAHARGDLVAAKTKSHATGTDSVAYFS